MPKPFEDIRGRQDAWGVYRRNAEYGYWNQPVKPKDEWGAHVSDDVDRLLFAVDAVEQRHLRAVDAIERVLAGHIDKHELHIILREQAEARRRYNVDPPAGPYG